MTEDRELRIDHPGAGELAERLEAYASGRLAPNRAAMARIRRGVLEEARVRAVEASIGRGWHRHGRARGRAAAVLLAAAMTLAGGAVALAGVAAGGPLYDTRLWLEAALLPADPDTRALERIHQLEARLLEAERAAAAGDAGAVAAALAAYRAAVEGALAEVGTDADRLAHLEAALGLHVAVLETLASTVPEAAADGIGRALEASQQAVQHLGKVKSNGQGGGNGGGRPADDPAATERPAHTRPPDATKKSGPPPTGPANAPDLDGEDASGEQGGQGSEDD